MRPFRVHLDDYKEVPDKEIYGLIEDRNKIKWLATSSGLYSFDGSQFVKHKHPEQIGESVFGLVLDSQDQLWYANLYGQVFKINKSGTLDLMVDSIEENQSFIPEITIDKDEILVVSKTDITLFKADDFESKTKISLPEPSGITSNVVVIGKERFLFQSPNLYKINGGTIQKVASYPLVETIYGKPQLLNLFNKPFLLVRLKSGNVQYDLQTTGTQIPLSIFREVQDKVINDLVLDNGKVTFSTMSGVFDYQLENENAILESTIFNDKPCTAYLKDFTGAEYVSTLNDGIYIIKSGQIEELYVPDKSDYNITHFLPYSKDRLLYVLDNSTIYNLNSNKISSFKVSPLKEQFFKYDPYHKRPLFFSRSLYSFDFEYQKLVEETFKPGLKDIAINQKDYYLGLYNRLEKWSIESQKETKILYGRTHLVHLLGNKILAMRSDSLIAFNLDLSQLNTIHFDDKPIAAEKIESKDENEVIIQDRDGRLFSLSYTSGENSDYSINPILIPDFSKLELTVRDFSVADNAIYILTNRGVVRKSLSNVQFLRLNGITDWKGIEKIKVQDSRIWISNGKQLISIKIDLFDTPLTKKELIIEEVLLQDEPLSSDKWIELENTHEPLVIQSKVLGEPFSDYLLPEYRHMNDSLWITSAGQNQNLILNSLEPGDHQIQIRRNDPLTGEKTDIQTLKIRVAYPIWRKFWFIALSSVGIFTIIFFIIKYTGEVLRRRFQKKLDKAELESKMNHLKLENLRSQMNPHFVFNSLNSLQDYILSNDKEHASSFLVRFSRLMRIYLNHSRRSFISLSNEIEAMRIYLSLENERYDNTIDYRIEINPDLDIEQVEVPSLFFQPYVENAISHGLHHKRTNRRLDIIFKPLNANLLKCVIQDNGIGRYCAGKYNQKEKHEAFSMMANKDRIQLLRNLFEQDLNIKIRDLVDPQGLPCGTKVIITLPLIRK